MESPLTRDAEHQLILDAQAGSTTALEQLLHDSYPQVYTVCRRMCSSREDAEDAAQQASISIVRGVKNFDHQSKFSTWVHRIAVNASLDLLRKHQRQVLVTPITESIQLVADSDRDPESVAIGAEQRDTVTRALDELSEEFRVPIILRDLLDWAYGDIAVFLDISPGTVKSRIHRGRQQLSELLTSLNPNQATIQDQGN